MNLSWLILYKRQTLWLNKLTLPLTNKSLFNQNLNPNNQCLTNPRLDHPILWLKLQTLTLEPLNPILK
ncbi:hypothetical protein TM233_67360 [Bradyrhizobium sp. TM233]|nr:hypothetical protein TM233_67360 [Bradyrhizobium sp. TM233]